jgi:hypothetical protein
MIQSNHPGRRIPPPTQKKNMLSLAYQRLIVNVCNAILNTRIKGGQFLISDNNGLLAIDEAVSSSSETVSGAPWQISEVDTNVFQVSDGIVNLSTFPKRDGFASGTQFLGVNTATNIALAASDFYTVYIKVWNSGSTDAEVVVINTAPPADWVCYPAPQHFDLEWPTPMDVGYVLIGFIDTNTSPAAITQYLFSNPDLLDFSNSGMMTYPIGGTVLGSIAWNSGETYRTGTNVTHSGGTWMRYRTDTGNNGGTPGSGTNDWLPL